MACIKPVKVSLMGPVAAKQGEKAAMAGNKPVETVDLTIDPRGQLLAWGVQVAGMVMGGVLDVQAAQTFDKDVTKLSWGGG